MSKKIPNVALRNIESLKRMKIFVPNQGQVQGHLIAEAIQDAAKPSQYLGRNLAAQIDGSANVPNAPSGIQAKHLGGGMIDVSISDQAQHPATNYFVELADNPGSRGLVWSIPVHQEMHSLGLSLMATGTFEPIPNSSTADRKPTATVILLPRK